MTLPTIHSPATAVERSPGLDASVPGLRSAALLVALLLVCYGVAAVGGLSTMEGVRSWYPGLNKPPWAPPNGAFGPIWAILYTTMAVGAWDAMRRDPKSFRLVLAWFFAQLSLNALWSPVLFAWLQVGAALLVISLLWMANTWIYWFNQ